MKVLFNTYKSQSFTGHGARNIGQVMTKLYKSAYQGELYPHTPDIIQVTAKMKDGVEVTGVANFFGGVFEGISLPYEHVKYKSEFCNTVLNRYNQAITHGKHLKNKSH